MSKIDTISTAFSVVHTQKEIKKATCETLAVGYAVIHKTANYIKALSK